MDATNPQRTDGTRRSWTLRSLALALLVLGSLATAAASAAPTVSRDSFTTDGEANLLAEADALQYGHRFADALELLATLLERDPAHVQARLMQARIHLAQGSLMAAQQSCQELLGQTDMTITATCLLEVAGRLKPERLPDTYQQLQRLYLQQPATVAVRHWQQQILAEQAFELGQYQAAIDWFGTRNFAAQPVVNQKLIIDAWLLLQEPRQVLSHYSACPRVGQLPEDSVIVRLAHAERLAAAEAADVADSAAGSAAGSAAADQEQQVRRCWRQLASERMQVRIARDDALHTSDIAYYFLYVDVNATQALHYAELNFAVAEEPADQRLLDAARTLTGTRAQN
ncbi:hypothetical protein J6I90_06660 [Pseudidiomarina sp. 1APP75-32.1]|uniref:Tetratricopeptide repeat protein n=1 Tax=Pseudidiomarina terrestris TaxID=2820060 RepID=A0AAW7QXG1_9GAMM|nr:MULTISPECIES: tetratricopeptide repeat protein [unclassified Pseudidiomarina]MDN7124558.1 hypothetical protein [Pseudidiomarina sp. 1APP75-32.1]MDN7129151.1 hypothetical protein [Pseudidiomarina sp. 1APR75-15]